jgi:hypothetical protein
LGSPFSFCWLWIGTRAKAGAGIDAGSPKVIQKITKCTFWLVAIFQRIGQILFCLARFRRLKAISIPFVWLYS